MYINLYQLNHRMYYDRLKVSDIVWHFVCKVCSTVTILPSLVKSYEASNLQANITFDAFCFGFARTCCTSKLFGYIGDKVTKVTEKARKERPPPLFCTDVDSIGCYIQIKSIYPSHALVVFLYQIWLIGHYSPSVSCSPSNCLGNWIYPKVVWGYYNHSVAIPSSN